MLTTKNSGALVSGPARRNKKAETMSEISIKFKDGRMTSKGPAQVGDVFELPQAEALFFLRNKYAVEADNGERRQPVVFDEPQIEDREADQAPTVSKRRGRPPKKKDADE